MNWRSVCAAFHAAAQKPAGFHLRIVTPKDRRRIEGVVRLFMEYVGDLDVDSLFELYTEQAQESFLDGSDLMEYILEDQGLLDGKWSTIKFGEFSYAIGGFGINVCLSCSESPNPARYIFIMCQEEKRWRIDSVVPVPEDSDQDILFH